MSAPSVWRSPDEESTGLYPSLVVHGGRVSGSITVGRSRLPLWAFVSPAVTRGWDDVEAGWSPTEHYGFTADDLGVFLADLLQARGEFGRLLLVLADAQRRWSEREDDAVEVLAEPWWLSDDRDRVLDQLRRCVAVLDGGAR